MNIRFLSVMAMLAVGCACPVDPTPEACPSSGDYVNLEAPTMSRDTLVDVSTNMFLAYGEIGAARHAVLSVNGTDVASETHENGSEVCGGRKQYHFIVAAPFHTGDRLVVRACTAMGECVASNTVTVR